MIKPLPCFFYACLALVVWWFTGIYIPASKPLYTVRQVTGLNESKPPVKPVKLPIEGAGLKKIFGESKGKGQNRVKRRSILTPTNIQLRVIAAEIAGFKSVQLYILKH